MSEKLMTNGQGISIAQMGRAKKVPSRNIQTRQEDISLVLDAIRDGRPITIGPIPTSVVYPDWVEERLTPELEVTTICDPGEVELHFDPRQQSSSLPTGHEVYEYHKADGGEILKRSLSLGELQFYEQNRDKIPGEWLKKRIRVYGWASVARSAHGSCYVPYLYCFVDRPYVDWYHLGFRWDADGPSGLRAS
jgi:hypothetical protein